MEDELWGDIITPEREAKGDLSCRRHEATGFIRHAEVRDCSVLAFLVERGILDPHHAYYAMVFEDMHRAFLMRVSHKSNALSVGSFGKSDGVLEGQYLEVTRELTRRCRRAEGRIRHALTTMIPEHVRDPQARRDNSRLQAELERLLYWKQPGKPAPFGPIEYRVAFDSLAQIIDELREQTSQGN